MTEDCARAAPISAWHGEVAPGFEGVADAFAENFRRRADVGAAFAAYVDDRPVVDLWGGVADRRSRAPWQRDTMQLIFSGTKGLVAVCLLLLIDRGQLDLDRSVAAYWPEFAAAGKGDVLVRHLVSHQGGVPGIRRRVTYDDLLDDRRMAGLLAAEAPFFPAGERVVYHPLTFGWLTGELIRRVDGRSVGRFFADEIAVPLGLDAWIGLPSRLEGRVARLHHGARWGRRAVFRADRTGQDPTFAAIWNNPIGRHGHAIPWNRSPFRAAEVPSANGIATARSMARLYACLSCGGTLDGVRLLSREAVELGRSCLARGDDPFLETPVAFGVGFEVQTELETFGPCSSAFGHCGAGGSVHGAWPDDRVAFSYAMNEMRDDAVSERGVALLAALRRGLDEHEQDAA